MSIMKVTAAAPKAVSTSTVWREPSSFAIPVCGSTTPGEHGRGGSERVREGPERLTGVALIVLALVLLAEKLLI